MTSEQPADSRRKRRSPAGDAVPPPADAAPGGGVEPSYDEEDFRETSPGAKRERSVMRLERGDLAGSYESLPVLAAFRDFIEIERKRTRNSMIVISCFFVVVLGLMIALGLTLGFVYVNRMRGEVAGTHADVGTVAGELVRSRDQTDAAIQNLATHTTRLQDQIRAGNLTADLALQQATTRSDLLTERMAKIADVVKALEGENRALRSQLDAVQAAQRPAPPPLPPVLPSAAPTTAAVTTPAAAPAPVPAASPVAAAAPASSNSLGLVIVPQGLSRAVRWRVPVPE